MPDALMLVGTDTSMRGDRGRRCRREKEDLGEQNKLRDFLYLEGNLTAQKESDF